MNTTIENMASGNYLLRCQQCDDTYELDVKSQQGMPVWALIALGRGFEIEHKDCRKVTP